MTTNTKPIYISTDDLSRLRLLLSSIQDKPGSRVLASLRAELDRAVVLPERPGTVVGLRSTVEVSDLDSGETDRYTLTLPEQADPAAGKLSVLAPLGTALLGFSEGDVVEWTMPGGLRRLRIQRVIQPES